MDEELLSSTIRNISDVTGYAPNVVLGGEGRRVELQLYKLEVLYHC